jgi:uncharacterized protein YqhQ
LTAGSSAAIVIAMAAETQPATKLPPTLGGQAVIEGVMIRGPRGMAVCVRKPDGELACRSEPAVAATALRRVPLLRGLAALGDTLSQGMRATIWSAQIAAGKEPAEPSQREVRATMTTSLAAAVGLFFVSPVLLTRRLERRMSNKRAAAAVEAGVRLGMLVGYLWFLGRFEQTRRLFAYHGAEHRAIQAYEASAPLEVESLEHFPNAHVRCGTSFLLTTTLVSSLVYSLIGPQPLKQRLLTRAALTPLIAGLSFEAIRLGSSARGPLRWLFRPNLALQSLTTRDPDASQMEVALAALHSVLALHES